MGIGYLFARRFDALRRWWTGRAPEEHERRLMQLYWNRAELKKALAQLQDEQHALLEKFKNHEGVTRRLEDQITQLRTHLGNPDVGAHALVYFQLCTIWRLGVERLKRFNGDLRGEQEERERRRHAAHWETRRATQAAELQERLHHAQVSADTLQVQLAALEARRGQLKAIWNYFERRALAREIVALRDQWEIAATAITDLSDESIDLAALPVPEFPGLSLEGRRIVNTATIAYAESLVTSLPHRALAPLAKQASGMQVYDAHCGSHEECSRVMAVAKLAIAKLSAPNPSLSVLKEPIERIRGRALYRSTEDTVPIAESIGDVVWESGLPAGTMDRKITKVNVLADDYWSLGQCLTR
ncbi:MAG: hypothetical protein H7Y02_10095 [Candidatus Obscuribacterales bacterium]|nr:hypothetical protein [Steroidobacteraceae bacterium]